VSTQLRLVETPTTSTPKASKPPKSSVAAARRASRRPVNWGDWRLDARTRSVGRAGVARARQALQEAAAAESLSQAS
jgi:hypothetical protein